MYMSISQLDFQLHNAGVSQCDRILARLNVKLGEWVAMPELSRLSGSLNVHSRISDLRNRLKKTGTHMIEQQNVWEGRVCKSFFRLVHEI